MRLLKILAVLVVLAFVALAGYAYLGDMGPRQQEMRKPVSLDAISRSAGLEPATVRPVLAWLVGRGLVIGVHGHWVRTPRAARTRGSAPGLG